MMILKKIKSACFTLRFSSLLRKAIVIAPALYSYGAQAAQAKTQAVNKTPLESLLPMLLGLVGIIALIVFLAFLLRKFTGLNLASNNIKVIETQRLGTKEKLVVIQIENKQLLLGVTPQNINLLTELESPITVKKPPVPFDKLMKQLINPGKTFADKASNESGAKND